MTLKKLVSLRSVLLFSVMFFLLFTELHTNAEEIPQNTAKAALYYQSHDNTKKAIADFTMDVNETERYEVGLFLPGNANPIKIQTVCYGYNRVRFKEIKRNQVYYYAVRKVDTETGISGKWSKKKAIVCPNYITKGLKGRDGYPVFSVKPPKIKGVTKYKLYTCQKVNGTYKYVGAIKPGKKQTVKFKNSKKIRISYFRLKVVLNNKISCTTGRTSGTNYDFWIKISYR